MLRYLKWAFHPAALIAVSALLVGAAGLVLLPHGQGGAPVPLPVRPGEQEIAWLYPATSATNWERFASAVRQATENLEGRLFPGLEWEHDGDGTARSTPQITLRWPGGQGKLVFRWYKLTSQQTTRAWIEALVARDPPPLAVVGGNVSDRARELAVELQRAAAALPPEKRPLLLLTTATADRVPRVTEGKDADSDAGLSPLEWGDDARTVQLLNLYGDPGHRPRTWRFCFSNLQMATAVTRFIWSQADLRPDGDPAYLVQWTDDAYSQDFFAGSLRVLESRARDNFAQQWGVMTGAVALGAYPAALGSWLSSHFRQDAPMRLDVDSSVGSFNAPNPYEARAVAEMLNLMRDGRPNRPLLVLTGQQQPSRRFLRDLARSAPELSRRFVVAAGDALSFNTIYRDRQVTWPIQDLPFTLVFFAHRNPIDEEAGFHPPPAERSPGEARVLPSGTEDLLLYRDIVEAVAMAYREVNSPSRNADDLAAGLAGIHLAGEPGVPLFGPDGQRSGGTGEHVVLVRPVVSKDGTRVLPKSTIEVWARHSDRQWRRVAEPLTVSYDEFEVHHGE
jgi:hypothetical protein